MNIYDNPYEKNMKYLFFAAGLLSLPTTLIKPEFNLFVFAAGYYLW